MQRRVLNCLIIIIIFFIGISLGANKEDPLVKEEKEIIDISEIDDGFLIRLAKTTEKIIDKIVFFILELVGGAIKLVIGLN